MSGHLILRILPEKSVREADAQFDLERVAAPDRYELLLGTVVPRPIALITTLAPSRLAKMTQS